MRIYIIHIYAHGKLNVRMVTRKYAHCSGSMRTVTGTVRIVIESMPIVIGSMRTAIGSVHMTVNNTRDAAIGVAVNESVDLFFFAGYRCGNGA